METVLGDVEVAILIDRCTASAAEAFAGPLQSTVRARLFGEKSFGKGTIQNIYASCQTLAVRLTSGEFFLPNGRRVSGVVLEPDVKVGLENGTAVEWLTASDR